MSEWRDYTESLEPGSDDALLAECFHWLNNHSCTHNLVSPKSTSTQMDSDHRAALLNRLMQRLNIR